MKITEILERQRKIYVNFLEEQISKSEGSSELLIESDTDEPEKYFRLYRFDCMEKDGEEFKVIEFNNDTYINHPPVNYKFRELQIELNPFYWNGCEIKIDGKIENWEFVINWIKGWIDEDADELVQNGSLSNKIHNFQRPIIQGNIVQLAIDLGSAKIDALIELINIFEELGIKKIKIHSESMFNEKEN